MTKTLVAYFSASGTTAHAAKEIAEAVEADLYEICPIRPYTARKSIFRGLSRKVCKFLC